MEKFITNSLVGNSFRILSYPDEGFQTKQHMPDDVKAALTALIDQGYDSRVPDNWRQYF